MKQYLFLLFVLPFFNTLLAQKPYQWTFSAIRNSKEEFDIHFVVELNKGWHIYSQITPEGGPMPTTFTFSKNPLYNRQGKVTEDGKLLVKFEKVFGVNVKYFEERASFSQKINLRTRVRTNISGTVEFMICTDKQCLPPTKQNFSIPLQ